MYCGYRSKVGCGHIHSANEAYSTLPFELVSGVCVSVCVCVCVCMLALYLGPMKKGGPAWYTLLRGTPENQIYNHISFYITLTVLSAYPIAGLPGGVHSLMCVTYHHSNSNGIS